MGKPFTGSYNPPRYGRISLTQGIGVQLDPTPFGVCITFYKEGVNLASLSCEPNLTNTLVIGTGPVTPFDGTLLEAIDLVRGRVRQATYVIPIAIEGGQV